MTDPAGKALKAYEEQYNKKPKDAAALVAFVKKTKELKPITQEQAAAILSATATGKESNKTEKERASKSEKNEKSEKPEKSEKNDKTKGKEKEKEKEKEKKEEEEKEKDNEVEKTKETPKDAQPEVPLYAIEDEVLMSKDRIGVVRYVGDIPELGDGLWYGVELIDGSVGQSDGVVQGKRYFTTEGKRALFVRSSKIRRKMTSRDYKKHDSMRLMQERKRESITRIAQNDKVSSPVSTEVKEENGPSVNGATAPTDQKQPQPNAETKPPAMNEYSANENVSEPLATSDYVKYKEAANSNVSHHRRASSLPVNLIDVSATKACETLLAFILKQSEELREQLLDVYANPELNHILVNSFSELKDMEMNEQERIWNALLTRWKRYTK